MPIARTKLSCWKWCFRTTPATLARCSAVRRWCGWKRGFIVASRHARRTVVTARSEEVNFCVPVRAGQLVELIASVVKVGRSSMTVEVEMTVEDLLSGDRRVCTAGRFVMIALVRTVPPPPFRHCSSRPPESCADRETIGGKDPS